jgi:predicted O-methyltransferase YrrM
MSLKQAHQITDFIHEHKMRAVLELGFAHGVSTCYIAAALEESGGGSVTTIDLEGARNRRPNIEQLFGRCEFRDVVVTRYYEPTSYTWRLMRLLEQDPLPQFNLCYLDGAHSWFVDGFAFFLVDRLLRVGGWVIFDDLDWTYASSPTLHDTARVKSMPADERETPHMRKVYELLVKTHPCYGEFRVQDGWAYAHKVSGSMIASDQVRQETIYRTRPEPVTVKPAISQLFKRAIGRFRKKSRPNSNRLRHPLVDTI